MSKKEDAVLTTVYFDWDNGEAFYLDDELYTHVHCNDTHEIPDILISIMLNYNITRREHIGVYNNNALEKLFEDSYSPPDSLAELNKIIEESQ